MLRSLARETCRSRLVEGPSGFAGHELVHELIDLLEHHPDDEGEARRAMVASALYSLADVGDYVGELCCRIPWCTRWVWPSFDRVCFEHGMEEQPR